MTVSSIQIKPEVPRALSRWGQGRRLEFIDYRLCWSGRINRSDLTAFFGISIPQASLDIGRYLELAPASMDYNRGAKVYLAAKDFTPIFASTNSAGFLNELLALERGLLTKETMPLGWAPEVSVAPVPSRPLSANLLAALLQAVRDKASLSIGYQSMSSPEPVARVISPHAFAHDGSRWHVRAWCHMRGQYRDFVIGRILEASPSELASPPITGDLAWLNVLELVISPHPNLSAGQRRVIELDYGMENGEARISCREALLFYVVKHLRLDQDVGAAREQQIVWKNRHELDRYLKS